MSSGYLDWQFNEQVETRTYVLGRPTGSSAYRHFSTSSQVHRVYYYGAAQHIDFGGDVFHAFDMALSGSIHTETQLTAPFSGVAGSPATLTWPQTTGSVLMSFGSEIGKGKLKSLEIDFDFTGSTTRTVAATGAIISNEVGLEATGAFGKLQSMPVFEGPLSGIPVLTHGAPNLLSDNGGFAAEQSNLLNLYPNNIFQDEFVGAVGWNAHITALGTAESIRILLNKIQRIKLTKLYLRRQWKASITVAHADLTVSTNPTWVGPTQPVVPPHNVRTAKEDGQAKFCPTYVVLYNSQGEMYGIAAIPTRAVLGPGHSLTIDLRLNRY